MATETSKNKFSIYAGLGDSPDINWSQVASTLSQGLQGVLEKKKAERKAIDEATNKQMEALNELPDVNSRSLGRVVIEASAQSKEELRMRMDLVRRGLSKPTDYKVFMQEQKNGYSSFSNIVKTYDKWYTDAKTKVDDGTATALHIATMKQIESFGNLNDKKIYTNPANGQLQVVTMEKDADGKYTKMPSSKKNPDNFQNPGNVLSLMTYDGGERVDLGVETKKITDELAVIIDSQVANGSVTSFEDFRNAFADTERMKSLGLTDDEIATYDDWLSAKSDVFVSSDADMLEILVTDGKYQIDDPKKANYLKINYNGTEPVVEWGDEAAAEKYREEAKTIVERKINEQIDSKIKQTPGFDQNRNKKDDRSYNNKIAKGTKIVDSLNSVYSGGQEEVDGALANLFAEAGLRYENFRQDGDNFYLRYKKDGPNGTEIREEQKIPKGANKEEFMQNAYQFFNLGGDIDYDTARNKANVGERGYAEVDVDKKGDPIYYKSTKDADGNVIDYLDKEGKATTNRKDFVIMPAPKKLTADQIKAGEVQKEQEGSTRKIKRQRGTQTEAPQEQRDAILSSSTVGSGSNAVLVSSYYDEAVNKIGNKLVFDGNEKEMNALEGGIRTAINSAAEARGDLTAAQNVKYSTSGNIITITFKGGTAQLDTKGLKANQLRAAVNKEVDKVLTAILPAQKGGYEGLDYGNK